ncbi:hypothetical protein [Anoxybacillus sp. FSL W8-1294]|jgi:hypothetical protein|uniref:hypothetical protein n=3 Tax=Bacillales TaxID=1385 RepID=UPI0030D301F7
MCQLSLLESLNKRKDELLQNHLYSHPFFVLIENGTLHEDRVKRLVIELALFYDRVFDCVSPFLSSQEVKDVKEYLSYWYVHAMSNLNPDQLAEEVKNLVFEEFDLEKTLALPSGLAITNHMLYLSQNDPYAFIVCINTLFNEAWQTDRILKALSSHKTYNRFYDIVKKIFMNLNLDKNVIDLLQDETSYLLSGEQRFLKQLRLLVETFEIFFTEIAHEDNKDNQVRVGNSLQTI